MSTPWAQPRGATVNQQHIQPLGGAQANPPQQPPQGPAASTRGRGGYHHRGGRGRQSQMTTSASGSGGSFFDRLGEESNGPPPYGLTMDRPRRGGRGRGGTAMSHRGGRGGNFEDRHSPHQGGGQGGGGHRYITRPPDQVLLRCTLCRHVLNVFHCFTEESMNDVGRCVKCSALMHGGVWVKGTCCISPQQTGEREQKKKNKGEGEEEFCLIDAIWDPKKNWNFPTKFTLHKNQCFNRQLPKVGETVNIFGAATMQVVGSKNKDNKPSLQFDAFQLSPQGVGLTVPCPVVSVSNHGASMLCRSPLYPCDIQLPVVSNVSAYNVQVGEVLNVYVQPPYLVAEEEGGWHLQGTILPWRVCPESLRFRVEKTSHQNSEKEGGGKENSDGETPSSIVLMMEKPAEDPTQEKQQPILSVVGETKNICCHEIHNVDPNFLKNIESETSEMLAVAQEHRQNSPIGFSRNLAGMLFKMYKAPMTIFTGTGYMLLSSEIAREIDLQFLHATIFPMNTKSPHYFAFVSFEKSHEMERVKAILTHRFLCRYPRNDSTTPWFLEESIDSRNGHPKQCLVLPPSDSTKASTISAASQNSATTTTTSTSDEEKRKNTAEGNLPSDIMAANALLSSFSDLNHRNVLTSGAQQKIEDLMTKMAQEDPKKKVEVQMAIDKLRRFAAPVITIDDPTARMKDDAVQCWKEGGGKIICVAFSTACPLPDPNANPLEFQKIIATFQKLHNWPENDDDEDIVFQCRKVPALMEAGKYDRNQLLLKLGNALKISSQEGDAQLENMKSMVSILSDGGNNVQFQFKKSGGSYSVSTLCNKMKALGDEWSKLREVGLSHLMVLKNEVGITRKDLAEARKNLLKSYGGASGFKALFNGANTLGQSRYERRGALVIEFAFDATTGLPLLRAFPTSKNGEGGGGKNEEKNNLLPVWDAYIRRQHIDHCLTFQQIEAWQEKECPLLPEELHEALTMMNFVTGKMKAEEERIKQKEKEKDEKEEKAGVKQKLPKEEEEGGGKEMEERKEEDLNAMERMLSNLSREEQEVSSREEFESPILPKGGTSREKIQNNPSVFFSTLSTKIEEMRGKQYNVTLNGVPLKSKVDMLGHFMHLAKEKMKEVLWEFLQFGISHDHSTATLPKDTKAQLNYLFQNRLPKPQASTEDYRSIVHEFGAATLCDAVLACGKDKPENSASPCYHLVVAPSLLKSYGGGENFYAKFKSFVKADDRGKFLWEGLKDDIYPDDLSMAASAPLRKYHHLLAQVLFMMAVQRQKEGGSSSSSYLTNVERENILIHYIQLKGDLQEAEGKKSEGDDMMALHYLRHLPLHTKKVALVEGIVTFEHWKLKPVPPAAAANHQPPDQNVTTNTFAPRGWAPSEAVSIVVPKLMWSVPKINDAFPTVFGPQEQGVLQELQGKCAATQMLTCQFPIKNKRKTSEASTCGTTTTNATVTSYPQQEEEEESHFSNYLPMSRQKLLIIGEKCGYFEPLTCFWISPRVSSYLELIHEPFWEDLVPDPSLRALIMERLVHEYNNTSGSLEQKKTVMSSAAVAQKSNVAPTESVSLIPASFVGLTKFFKTS